MGSNVPERYLVPERVRAGSPSPIRTWADYLDASAKAANDPSGYWLKEALERIQWERAPTEGLKGDYRSVRDEPLTWFADGTLNVAVNTLDRHLAARGDKIAIL